MSSNGRCVFQGTTGRTSPLELHCLPWRLGGLVDFFFSTARALSYKTCVLGLLLSLKSLVDRFGQAVIFSFVETAKIRGTGALYIGDMTNGRLIRWPIGAKQGEKPKLNFHG